MIAIALKAAAAAAQTGAVAGHSGYLHLGAYRAGGAKGLQWTANQAALPQQQSIAASVYGEKRFLLDDLSLVHLGVALPVRAGSFGIQAFSAGSGAFNQNRVGIAYGRSLGAQINIGVQFNYHYYHIAGYGSAAAVTVEGGLLYQLSPNVLAGVHIANPTRSGFFRYHDERLPAATGAGLGYSPSPDLHLSTTLVKQWKGPLDVQAGLQYNPGRRLLVKGGVATAAPAYFVAVGYDLTPVQLEVVAFFHPQLGISPGLMLTFKGNAE